MSALIDFYRTTVGKKVVMAVSGLVLVGFVVGHMAGNLKMFSGSETTSGRYKLDIYAEFLREIGAGFLGHETFLWIVRAVLLLCLALHVGAAAQLIVLNAKAKPLSSKRPWYGSSNPASRSMVYGGVFLLCFVIFHILHLTTGTVHYQGFEHGMVYANIFRGFQSSAVTLFYLLAMMCLALHLYHGLWSLFQTLGIDSPTWNSGLRLIAKVTAILLFIGFSSVPIAARFNLISQPSAQAAHHVGQ